MHQHLASLLSYIASNGCYCFYLAHSSLTYVTHKFSFFYRTGNKVEQEQEEEEEEEEIERAEGGGLFSKLL